MKTKKSFLVWAIIFSIIYLVAQYCVPWIVFPETRNINPSCGFNIYIGLLIIIFFILFTSIRKEKDFQARWFCKILFGTYLMMYILFNYFSMWELHRSIVIELLSTVLLCAPVLLSIWISAVMMKRWKQIKKNKPIKKIGLGSSPSKN